MITLGYFFVSIALFDLDNTLLNGDSDYLWGKFLVEHGIVDPEYYENTNARFYEEYRQGTLDIYQFLEFALAPLAANDINQLMEWRGQFVEEKIKSILLPDAFDLIDKHRSNGDTLLVITATNQFVTKPIVDLYGIENLLATIPEYLDGRFTGQVSGIPCFKDGKVKRLESWLTETGLTLNDSWFYSDSLNDLPLLQRVDHPVAVDPDTTLRSVASDNKWPIISLRGAMPADQRSSY